MRPAERDARIPLQFFGAEQRQTASASERLLLGRLFQNTECTQAELTEALPLSQQSISRMASALTKNELVVRNTPRTNGQRGQPSAVLSLNPDYAYCIGISLMADGVALTLIDFSGASRYHSQLSITDLERETVIKAVQKGVASLVKKTKIDRNRIFGAGLATTGFRVGDTAKFNTPPSLEKFAFVDLEHVFSDALSLPVWAENDGKTATIAENMNGVGRRLSNFAYFYIAAGVGGGIVVDGNVMRGRHGNAGEFVGVLPIEHYPFPNLELLRRHINAHGQGLASITELVSRYDDDWPGIDDWIQEAAPSLSLMASATASILDTEAIVLGGRLPRKLALRLIPYIEFFDIKRRSVPRQHAEVIPAECQGDATAIGAALLPFADKFFAF